MSYCLVVAEKPSVGAAYAKVLGATNRQDGYWEGNGYLVSWCVGHLVELAPPNVYDAKYVKWSIINYAKTRPVYDAYRKTGYSKHFLEGHRAEITLHKAAKAAFDEANLKKLPKVKELDTEYSKLLTEKKALYPDYRKAKEEMQELLRAKRNVELFFAEEKSSTEKTKSR